jgi:hypothetical protein
MLDLPRNRSPDCGVVEDRVCGVDRVLSVDVSAFGGLPVLLDPSPYIGVTINRAVHP